MTSGPAAGRVGAGSGLFGPDSLSWRVNREAVLLLGGPRALLLQLAHPLVAAGVAEHSDFLRDPMGRLRRTLTTMLSIVFGDAATVAECAARIADTHARVRGTLREGTRSFPAGSVYDASDPRLLLWVHATLVDSALVTYEWLVAPLTEIERARLYEESKTVARLLGVPDRDLPDTYSSFARYVADMLAGPLAEITPTARRLGRSVLEPPIPFLPPGALRPRGARHRRSFASRRSRELRARVGRPSRASPWHARAHRADVASVDTGRGAGNAAGPRRRGEKYRLRSAALGG
jgi:uncharacterized protein (DUF2236 family)